MITSAIVAAEMVAQSYPGVNILVSGDIGLVKALQAYDLQLMDWDSEPIADLVIMGKAPLFDQQRLHTVCQNIWNGAKFIATNNDRKMPVTDGYIPGTGAMVQAVAYATVVRPIVTGKPSIYAAQTVLNRLVVQANQAVMQI